ncbi:hypothetical protein BP6252_13445 [Coleophoma cylindrospora]|uniref:Probable glucan endo-1,3-beta-glucosidase eglC n=1 Tax=Coleophoma cylindrospora TaxID=1849047 RepID=A0A3D8Q9A6_9HELO|nr:hypothetical protein BP6252_13445 [Coleophoma cylindrospora]
MRSSTILALAASFSTTSAVSKGFNYGATQNDGTVKMEADFTAEFNAAKSLVGTSGFTSARLYTTVQSGGGPISAIPAAIKTSTELLLGIWVSGGAAGVQTEIDALTSAISTYGTSFTDLVIGLSIGSEDLYRNSPTGIAANAGIGADPSAIVDAINKVKTALAGTSLADVSIGHVDTWTAWVNGSNTAVAEACDWIGMDAYPFFQNTEANAIDQGKSLFVEAYQNTQAMSAGKPVWITETGWPVSGAASGAAVASTANAKTYWDEVGCGFAFDQINTFWYTLQDAYPTTPDPSFGVVGTTLSSTPLFDLSCSNITATSTNSSSTTTEAASSAQTAASSAASVGGGLSPSQGAGNGGSGLNGTASTTLASVAAGSTGTSGSGSSSNGTYVATSKTAAGGASATATSSSSSSSSTGASSNSGSAISGSAFAGLAGALLAMVFAL